MKLAEIRHTPYDQRVQLIFYLLHSYPDGRYGVYAEYERTKNCKWVLSGHGSCLMLSISAMYSSIAFGRSSSSCAYI